MEEKKPAEKRRSTYGKKTKITINDQQMVETRADFNWAALGSSSAIITILATAMLFMIGWSYISNWYSYFGISIENINISLQQVLIYSTSSVTFLITSAGLGYFLYSWFLGFKGRTLKPLLINDWFSILVLTVVVMVGWLLYWINTLLPSGIQVPIEFTYLSLLLAALVLIAILSPVYIFLISESRSTFLRIVKKKSKDEIKESTLDLSFLLAEGHLRWVIISLIAFVTLMSFSAINAFSDASTGKKGFGGFVQEVLLISPKPIEAIDNSKLSCNKNTNCVYGPFGIIHETNNSFYLVSWQQLEKQVFKQNPGLYILPRADQNGPYFIVPVPQTAVTPTPMITLTPTNTQP